MFWKHALVSILVIANSKCDDKQLNEFVGLSTNYKILKNINLPNDVNETSGLLLFDSLILTINDSGNKPKIYGVNKELGMISRTWNVINAVNRDWESLAADNDFIYIGDFGNNIGSRKDLAIYMIPLTEFVSFDSVEAEKIEFIFEDQSSFLPSIYNHSFDCEAMISLNESLILFSKDWKNKITTLYKLPNTPGNHVAKKIISFNSEGLITGADYFEEDKLLVLCGYENYNPFIWKIQHFQLDNPNLANAIKYELNDYSGIQNEGIAIFTKDSIYMSAEASFVKQKLYLLHLKE